MDRDGANGGAAARPLSFVPFTAKLNPPALDDRTTDRRDLVDMLTRFTGIHVAITAPAGYGKSTLAAQWCTADPRPTAWLSLDAADHDPYVLATYLGLALDAIDPLGDAELETLTRRDVPTDELFGALRRVLATRPRPFLLVVDDVHLVEGAAEHPVLAVLGRHVPPGSTVAFVTRGTPPLRASREIVLGDLLRLDVTQLAMTTDETAAVLRAAGLDTDDATIAALHERTEGWAAGLYLAALALRDADDPGATIDGIRGRRREIADFFADEVLPALAPEDAEFLLATAVLGRCSGDLCDVALQRRGSGAVLERLARENRFVIPLDDTGDWYRYHHLFADMLEAELRRRDPATVDTVARRASEWWEARFDPDPAVFLALAGNDRARAIDLIARFGPLLQNGRLLPTVGRWLDQFSDDEIAAHLELAVVAAWNALLVGDVAGVHLGAAVVQRAPADATLPDGTGPDAAAALLRALTNSHGLTDMRAEAARAFAEHPERSMYRAVAATIESHTALLLGDWDGARTASDEAIARGRQGLAASYCHGLSNRARLASIDGDLELCDRSVEELRGNIREHWLDERPAMGLARSFVALHLARRGLAAAADEERRRTLPLIERLEDVTPFVVVSCLLELAEAAVLTGHVDDATDLLAEAERRLRRLRDTGLLPFAVERVRGLVAAATVSPAADLVDPLSAAERRVLQFLPTHLSFGEIGEELFVSRNTVKSHAMAIYRKLGVTSRSAAVKEAANLGLLQI